MDYRQLGGIIMMMDYLIFMLRMIIWGQIIYFRIWGKIKMELLNLKMLFQALFLIPHGFQWDLIIATSTMMD